MRAAWSGFRRGVSNPPVGGRRHCPMCGRWRTLLDFRPNTNTKHRCSSYCTPCVRAKSRARYAAMTSEQAMDRRESQRFYAEGRRRKAGLPVRQFKNRRTVIDQAEMILLPPEPLLDEMKAYVRAHPPDPADHDTGWERLAREAGMDARQLRRIVAGESKRVRVDVADRLAHAMGLPLELVYGGIAGETMNGAARSFR